MEAVVYISINFTFEATTSKIEKSDGSVFALLLPPIQKQERMNAIINNLQSTTLLHVNKTKKSLWTIYVRIFE